MGSNGKRFAEITKPDGSTLVVPVVKDAGTFIYLATPEGGWPKEPLTTLLVDANWLVEGASFELEEMRPGKGMGEKRAVMVIEHKVVVANGTGKYGQVKRMILVDEVESFDEVMAVRRESN